MNLKFTILALITLALLSWGLYEALEGAPTEATMGNVQRIFYYHVPSAWVAFLCFIVNFVASIIYLKNRSAKVDAVAVSTAEVGVVFCTIVLLTGPIWARPVWGIWWTWDARLTSTLVLWLIYVSYLVLRRYSIGGPNPVLAASLAVFGFVDVIFVYMAIRWFRTQHPQPVIGGAKGSGIDPTMLKALLINFAAFLAFAFLVIWLRFTLERVRQRVEEAHAMKALNATAARVIR
jgi:heme exporter protein C